MLSRLHTFSALTMIFGILVFSSGCIFPDDSVTIDIYGSDEIPANNSKANGFRIRINNEMDTDYDNLTVMITVPENINFRGFPGGKPMEIDKGLDWVYTFSTGIPAGDTAEYSFTYEPIVYASQFGGELEWSYVLNIQVFSEDGDSLGNQTTTWRVTR